MSGELQTIPARHGVATFVPRGRTIKVINTYGRQVVSMWAFSLGPPPEEGDDEQAEGEEVDEKKVQEEAEGLKKAVEGQGEDASESKENAEEAPSKEETTQKETESTSKDTEQKEDDNDDPPEQAPDTPDNEKTTESTESSKQPAKRTWGSYLPSIPYRSKAKKPEDAAKPTAEEEKKQTEENTKKWSSYLPTGKGFSSYVPNVQIPDSKTAISAFQASHYRDPNKSYAEQLYDFSKTPVGAGGLAVATGSGYASSVYAAYSAYASTHPSNASQPPMEYLSLPHTRAASHKLVPEVDDELLTNLRNPIITLVEDTTPGAHDTLTAACDANQYTALGVDKPEEHGSCAENLVLALKELNETAGLKGAKAIGADITVNIAPTPLHLFMNVPITVDSKSQEEGAGAKGVTLKVEEPKGKKRGYVRFRAERDVVVVFSACPMDIGQQNGGRCMAANFLVEDVKEGEDLASSVASLKGKKGAPKKLEGGKKAPAKKEEKKVEKEAAKEEEKDIEQPKQDAAEEKEEDKPADKDKADEKPGSDEKPADKTEKDNKSAPKSDNTPPSETPPSNEPKPKKKPKKLQVRSATPASSS